MPGRVLLALLITGWLATPALAKEYRADRFDVRIEVLPGGHLHVTETIVFRFLEGTFREVFRTVPARRTDGIEFVSASMDGAALPRGDGAGTLRVRGGSRLRVDWRFAPVANSTHTFELVYVVRGVVRQAGGGELLEWRALPREHGYRIDEAEVVIMAPVEPSDTPTLESRRVEGGSRIFADGTTITAQASQLRRNGSLVLSIPFARGSVLDGPPAWQARQTRHAERAPIWLATSGGVLLAGLLVLFAIRQHYDAPPPDLGVQWRSMLPPDPLPPALGGTLAANGSPGLQHAMAALFSLAEQGVLTIREEPKRTFGQREFTIERQRSSEHPSPHEAAALEIIFEDTQAPGARVTLSKARSRLTRHFSAFKAAVRQELSVAGLLDPGREANRRSFVVTGVILLAAAGVVTVACLPFLESFGAWPLLIPLALGIVAMVSFIMTASQTPLSNEGVRRAEQWRSFRKHLSDPQSIEPRWGAAGSAEARILPFAVGLGLAAAWSKYMKKRNVRTPGWFHAASGLESGQAFATFVASGGAIHGGGGGAGVGAGGVAGGGASGAR
jgi:hypothetical protein